MLSSSSSMIRRVVPFFTNRIRQNYRLLNSYASSALSQPQPQSQLEAPDSVVMTDNCVRRMKELQAGEHKEKMLRLSIEAGGCSGFQYEFSLDDKTNSDDRIFERDGVKLVVDNVSFDFVKGATVDYVEELIRSAFQSYLVPIAGGRWRPDRYLVELVEVRASWPGHHGYIEKVKIYQK